MKPNQLILTTKMIGQVKLEVQVPLVLSLRLRLGLWFMRLGAKISGVAKIDMKSTDEPNHPQAKPWKPDRLE